MNRKVVVVEDDKILAYALGLLLSKAGYEVAVFTNANEAWDDLRKDQRPLLLITDVRFPAGQTNGLALAAHAGSRHRHLPVIFISGFGDVAPPVRRESGVHLFAKPILEDALMTCVRDLAPLA
jgi:FixJ family two-component response regulator